MAKKLSQQDPITVSTASDLFYVVDIETGNSYKITKANLMGKPGPIGDLVPDTGEFTQITIGTETISEFSTDGTLTDDSDLKLPTQKAVKTYVDNLSTVKFNVSQAFHGFDVLNAIYHDGLSWNLAQADNSDTLGTHLVIDVSDANNFTACQAGRNEITGHGLTPGDYYFVSDSTAGMLVSIEPETFSNPMVYVETANILHVLPFRPSFYGEAGWEVGVSEVSTTKNVVIDGSVSIGNMSLPAASVSPDTTTEYTLLSTDNGRPVKLTNAEAITLNVPAGLGAGFNCLIIQGGAGAITPTAGDGVTINQRQSLTVTAGQHAVASLLATEANVFVLGGDLA